MHTRMVTKQEPPLPAAPCAHYDPSTQAGTHGDAIHPVDADEAFAADGVDYLYHTRHNQVLNLLALLVDLWFINCYVLAQLSLHTQRAQPHAAVCERSGCMESHGQGKACACGCWLQEHDVWRADHTQRSSRGCHCSTASPHLACRSRTASPHLACLWVSCSPSILGLVSHHHPAHGAH